MAILGAENDNTGSQFGTGWQLCITAQIQKWMQKAEMQTEHS